MHGKGVAWEVSGMLAVSLNMTFTYLEILAIRCFTSRKTGHLLGKAHSHLPKRCKRKILKIACTNLCSLAKR